MEDPTPTVDPPSQPPQRFRRVRIAVSVFFGVLTVALCVLWVRSYWRMDQVFGHAGELLIFNSDNGYLGFSCIEGVNRQLLPKSGWKRSVTSATGFVPIALYSSHRGETIVNVHYSWPTVLAAVIAAISVPFQKPRFSVRTMLIATTLVAVVLGLGVWLAR